MLLTFFELILNFSRFLKSLKPLVYWDCRNFQPLLL
nr:MAG TPA: hypothetical protein [Caudoviricetes sp.]DAM41017.1 MAG TPA: hypothetical protein [Caudoviricetes sp.]